MTAPTGGDTEITTSSVVVQEKNGTAPVLGNPPLHQKQLVKRQDMTWHDHLVMLLQLGASIEHALMVQYLYAAYSLGGEQVPLQHQPMVQQWQETILSVAREEMGHLMTVQNVLTLLGAGINFNRENFPWDIRYYPFPFVLEPFTRGSLACYVYAEMPEDEAFEERQEIKTLAGIDSGVGAHLHTVGEIYSDIIELLGNPERIPDSAFDEVSIGMQASWEDWGRGYRPDPRPLDAEGNLAKADAEVDKQAQFRAHVMVDRVATRTQALAALRALSVQGEGPHGTADGEWSHFKRFIKIFRELDTVKVEGWEPARPVPRNPNTLGDPDAPNRPGFITSSRSRDWAQLFNLRYRLLLNFLAHTFRLARVTRADEPSQRAILMHRVFGEMYNLKTIAGILVQLPLHDEVEGDAARNALRAGPPFEMPYTMSLPPGEADTWCMHLDVIGSSGSVCHRILSKNPRAEDRAYVETLLNLDEQARQIMLKILEGLGKKERYWR